MNAGQYLLEATSVCGVAICTGPVNVGEGIILVDTYLAPNGWTPKFVPLTPVDQAIRHFTASRNSRPAGGSDLMVALRRAIITDPKHDGADCPRAGALIAHVEGHRPLQMWFGDEDCLSGECDCESDENGNCPEVKPAGQLCMACSAVYDSGSEWGPEWLPEARVAWPCAPLRAVAANYQIPLSN